MDIIQKRIEEWTKPPFDNETIKEINTLIKNNNEKELTDRFYRILEFGTGGLRGVIGAGTNRMNLYTVGFATQGLANYIIKKNKSGMGVVIAYDSRKMSKEFAVEAASILAGNKIRVYLFDDISPTPLCSFAIRHLSAVSGIVITASHNPPEYNGYKVYWDDGGQVIPPADREIIAEVNEITSVSNVTKTDFSDALNKGLIEMIGNDVIGEYKLKLGKKALRKKNNSQVKIVYTPLHGTGYKIIPEILDHFGFRSVNMVSEQAVPDGSFPTVKSPNPEEKDAMNLSLKLAKEKNADIIMATDPDSDRMGIGFKNDKGDFILINGNQIGLMLEFYLLSRMKEENKLPENPAVIKTIVTTDIQDIVAESYGCRIDNVLTGFKWIAQKMHEYESAENTNINYVFGGEESFGYLPVDFVRDKDAVSSCYFFAEMADYISEKGISLYEYLKNIYIKYGLFVEDLHSLTLKGIDGMKRIEEIMKEFRDNPPKEFAGIEIIKFADIQSLEIKDKSGNIEKIKDLPKSNVLQYFLKDGSKVTIRPSGTEPKIKFYFSVNEKVNADNYDDMNISLKNRIESLKKDLLYKIDKISL